MHGFSEVPWDQDNRVACFWSERMHPSEGMQHETGLRLRPTKPGSGRLLQFFCKIGTLRFCPQNLWVALCGSGGQAVEICPGPASAKRNSPPTKN